MTHQLCTLCLGTKPEWISQIKPEIRDHKAHAGVLINDLFICEAHAEAIKTARVHAPDCWGSDAECNAEGCC